MLETIDLCKVYRPKRGVPVTALDHVSLKFPDRGMVFLLGKSGSGKSTLLNLLGGLDRYDSGEIRIEGVSSQAFKQQHFDSYRNTYVGFIFQEYNVLEEFSVGANIALALELQGRRAEDEAINAILDQVDLTGYGNRKPNELSGGQKQRVAIARALVKNPRIIMADEPTGALDSATGRQVLDTLKKLSADKLVIVVSHDREFAEQYADRIIELADGRVVRDQEFLPGEAIVPTASALTYHDNIVAVPGGYHLTEEDRAAINAYIDTRGSGVTLKLGETAAGGRRAVDTDLSRIPAPKPDSFKLIQSRLPMRSAVKIGAGGLKHKKFRLTVTILLSCISFGLFGLADTFGSYNHVQASTDSLIDSGITYVSIEKTVRREDNDYYRNYGERLRPEELEAITAETGVKMYGVYDPLTWEDMRFYSHYNNNATFTETDYHIFPTGFNGLAEIDTNTLKNMNATLVAGRLPDGTKDEIAVSTYVCETFIRGGYTNGEAFNEKGETVYQKITKAADMVGKTLQMGNRTFTITGVVDTGFDLSRYLPLIEAPEDGFSELDYLANYVLLNELDSATSYSLLQVAMVGEGYITRLQQTEPDLSITSRRGGYFCDEEGNGLVSDFSYIGTLAHVPGAQITWLDGERTTLGEKELVIPVDMVNWVELAEGESLADYFRRCGTLTLESYSYLANDDWLTDEGYTVVGLWDTSAYPELTQSILGSERLFSLFADENDGSFYFAMGAMPAERSEIEALVRFCNRTDNEVRYEMNNSVTYQLNAVHEILSELSTVFFWIGVGFAAFAALMLANFIGTSIAYKKQDIGILRAIGSRSNDVFRIFFSESFIIAAINFLLSSIGVGIATALINHLLRQNYGLLITVLHFGLRQIVLLFAVSLLVAALASFFPVRRIAAKRPIDAIRNR